MTQLSWADIEAEVRRVFTCTHEAALIVYKDSVDGRRTYRHQCQMCGWGGQHLKKDSLEVNARASAPAYDDKIRTAWFGARETYRRNLTSVARESEQSTWWAWYSDYLDSETWQQKRELVLHRAAGLCEGCMSAQAVQVHHLTYDRAGDELLFDLAAVCLDCHQKAHPNKQINSPQGVA